MHNVKKKFEEISRMTHDQLSRAHETTEKQTLEIANYVSQKEELEETISDLHNTIFDLKPISNSKSSEEDINQLQSKILESQDINTAQSENVNHKIKLETIPEPSSEVNDGSVVKQEGLLSKKDKKS